MQVYPRPDGQLHIPARPRSVALGLFDGLHPGHRQVILAATRTAHDGITPAVYTFDPHTIHTKGTLRRLCSPEEEQALLEDMGVEELFRVDFATVRHLSPENFVKEILHTQLGAVQVTCGFNYHFGAGGAGDATLLTRLCADYGIAVTVVPEVDEDGTTVSSTSIRDALAAGDMAAVRRLMGRPFRLQQTVTEGQRLGRRLGLPTINQTLPADRACPRFGVYVSCVQIGGDVFPAVTNIGVHPTVGATAPLAETYILDFDRDLYGTAPTVYPLRFLREEQTFASLDELKAQIERDIQAARTQFAPPEQPQTRAVFFDFDDTLDDRDAAFRQGLSVFLHHYYPSLSTAEHTRRQAEMFRYQREDYGNIIDYPTLIRHFLTQWPAEIPADPEAALRRFYHGFAAGSRPLPEVVPTLIALRQKGYLLGIITNGNRIPQTCKLDHSGLRPYLDLLVLAGEEGMQKPDPRLFHLAAARLGVPVSTCIYVGDHPVNDLAAAMDAGFGAIGILPHREPDHPVHDLPMPAVPTLSHVGDLLQLLENRTQGLDT